MQTIPLHDLESVTGGFDHAVAREKAENWATAGGYVGAAVGAVYLGLQTGSATFGTAAGGLAGAGLGYVAGYGKGAWDTRGTVDPGRD